MASAMSMPTSASASRWRTAWNEPIGRPNWMRLRACSQASSSMVRDAPDQLVGERQPSEGHGRWSSRRPSAPVTRSERAHLAGHLEQRQVGVDALDRPSTERRRRHGDGHGALGPSTATTRTDVRRGEPGGAEALHHAARRRPSVPGGSHRPIGGQHDPGARPPPAPRAWASTWPSADDVALAGSLELRTATRRRPADRPSQRLGPSQLVERGVEGVARVLGGGVARGSARTGGGLRRPSAVVPEVEQAAGDDVPLDLRAPAVDRGRPRVEVLGAPPSAVRVVPDGDLGGQGVGDQVEDRLFGWWPAAPCRPRSPGPSCSPSAMRCWVPRDRARKA